MSEYFNLDDYLYIADKKFSELLGLFMLDIENDSTFYDCISFNLLSKYIKETLELFDNLDIKRKKSLIVSLGKIKDVSFNRKKFFERQLKSNEKEIIISTLIALSNLSSIEDIDLSVFLNNEDNKIKASAIQLLAKQYGKEYKSNLRSYLKDEEPLIRITALDALDDIFDEDLYDDAINCLNDVDENVRELATNILNRIKSLNINTPNTLESVFY